MGTGGGIPNNGWDTRQRWGSSQGWDSRQGMGFQTRVGFQSWDGTPDIGEFRDMDGVTPDRDGRVPGMVGFQTGDGIPEAGGVPEMGWYGTRQGMMGAIHW